MSKRDYVISKAYRDMGVEKGLPSAFRGLNAPSLSTPGGLYGRQKLAANIAGKRAGASSNPAFRAGTMHQGATRAREARGTLALRTGNTTWPPRQLP